ncbi:MAG: hypothetical protein KY462_15800 [Actinobacteria bacterium]|nr:hypothetical protein [Actinomycetota bacterium]
MLYPATSTALTDLLSPANFRSAVMLFSASDVDAEFQRIKALGAEVVAEPNEPGGSDGMPICSLATGNYFQLAPPWGPSIDVGEGGQHHLRSFANSSSVSHSMPTERRLRQQQRQTILTGFRARSGRT